MATKKNATTPSAPVSATVQDPTIVHYEAALRLLQERHYDRAKAAFQALLSEAPRHVADRIRVHLSACEAKLGQTDHAPRTSAEIYDYAVVLMNEGRNDEARDQLQKLLRNDPDADFAHYGLAVLLAVANRPEDALRHLERSIELNSRNRLQARNDGDFQNMADDPRFTELLYPETLGDTASASWRS